MGQVQSSEVEKMKVLFINLDDDDMDISVQWINVPPFTKQSNEGFAKHGYPKGGPNAAYEKALEEGHGSWGMDMCKMDFYREDCVPVRGTGSEGRVWEDEDDEEGEEDE